MTDPVKDTMKLAEEVFEDVMGKEWRANVTVQARIQMAKNNIAYLQRFKRLTANGLDSIRNRLCWYHIYQRCALTSHYYFFNKHMVPRIEKLCTEWERVIKFPNNMILGLAKKEQAQFEKDYKASLTIMARLPNTDSMEG